MKLSRHQFLHLTAGAAAIPAMARIAKAQGYPSRPVRVIVSSGPGGAADIAARLSTTCMATSGSGLRTAGTGTTTARRLTDQPGSGAATQVFVSSVAVPGATRANSSVRPSASGAMSVFGSTRSAFGSLER
jgi:tripartite-type tricarboxylate transporter receptor subunit TctC